MKQRIDFGTRIAGDKARYPDEFITASQAATRYQLIPEFNGQTLFELSDDAQKEFSSQTEQLAAYISINGVSYWQPSTFEFVESNGKLYVSWKVSQIPLDTLFEIILVRQ